MKISYIGQDGLLVALQTLINRMTEKSDIIKFTTIDAYMNGNFDLLIADSQYFASTISPNLDKLKTKVLILGHYTDEFVQQSFCVDDNVSYIAYSQIELNLHNYLTEGSKAQVLAVD